MAAPRVSGFAPSRRLQGGERFRVTLDEKRSFIGSRPVDVSLFGVVTIAPPDVMLSAYWAIDRSRFFYTISPVPLNASRVLTVNVKTRLEASKTAITVGEALVDMQRAIGSWVDIFSVTALDIQEVANVEERSRQTEAAIEEGAGAGTLQNILHGGAGVVSGVTGAIGDVLAKAGNVTKFLVVAVAAVAVITVIGQVKKVT